MPGKQLPRLGLAAVLLGLLLAGVPSPVGLQPQIPAVGLQPQIPAEDYYSYAYEDSNVAARDADYDEDVDDYVAADELSANYIAPVEEDEEGKAVVAAKDVSSEDFADENVAEESATVPTELDVEEESPDMPDLAIRTAADDSSGGKGKLKPPPEKKPSKATTTTTVAPPTAVLDVVPLNSVVKKVSEALLEAAMIDLNIQIAEFLISRQQKSAQNRPTQKPSSAASKGSVDVNVDDLVFEEDKQPPPPKRRPTSKPEGGRPLPAKGSSGIGKTKTTPSRRPSSQSRRREPRLRVTGTTSGQTTATVDGNVIKSRLSGLLEVLGQLQQLGALQSEPEAEVRTQQETPTAQLVFQSSSPTKESQRQPQSG